MEVTFFPHINFNKKSFEDSLSIDFKLTCFADIFSLTYKSIQRASIS